MKPIFAALFLMGTAFGAPAFRADFQHGFNGWMSYPLPQDIGFDPTLIVEQRARRAVLVRQVASLGEARLSTGFIRPLRFTASAATRVRLRYAATWPAADVSFRLILAAEDGRRYETALPAAGPNEVTVTGDELRLPRGAATIEAIVLVGRAVQPKVGAINRIELREFELDGATLASPDQNRKTFRLSPIAHPRVLFSAERLVQLRPLAQQVHEQARALAGKLKDVAAAGAAIATLPAGETLRPSFDGELTSYFQAADGYSNAIAWNALDYALSGDQAALETARRNLLGMSRWKTWTPPRFASHGMHTYYETGIVAQRLALAYDLIATRLTADEKAAVTNAFWAKCISPTIEEYVTYDRMPTGASNWMSNSVGGALAALAATVGDVPGRHHLEDTVLGQLVAAYQRNLRGLFPGDGSEREPAGYEHFAMEGISWGAAALRGLGIRPAGTEEMLEGFWWPYYAMVRPDLTLDTGDFNGEFRTLRGFAFGAEFDGIAALRAFYDRLDRKGRIPDLLELVCCSTPAQPAGEAPPSRVFRGRGSAVLRSGWGPDATVISLRAGPWFNHEHHDQGSFQVAAFGSRVISEAGYAHYYLDPNYPTYFTQAPGHNTVLVDGDAFSQGEYDADFWKALNRHPAFTDELLSDSADYLVADLAPAYGDRLSEYRRQYLFLAPNVLVVRDDLRAPQPHVFTWLLHTGENAGIEVRGNRAMITVGDAQAAVTARDETVWQEYETPLPVVIAQHQVNASTAGKGVASHDGKPPKRPALRIASTRSTAARFEVAMEFQERLATPSQLLPLELSNASGFSGVEVWALFRNGPGDLRFRNFESDGSVFAGRRADEWMAIGARSVRAYGTPLFTASAPTNAAWRSSKAGIDLDVRLDAPTSITVWAGGPVSAVFVDGAPANYRMHERAVELIQLDKGTHRVRIAARASL